MTLLKFMLADGTIHSFTDFYHAIRFCEEEFGHSGEEWDYIKGTINHNVLYLYLLDDEISVELINE